jgi:hypothetical protein
MQLLAILLLVATRTAQAFSAIKMNTPESVVTAHVLALQQKDYQEAFRYNSLENQAITGPTWQEFGELLEETPSFVYLLGHTKADLLMTVTHDDWGMSCLVRVEPSRQHNNICREYWFEASIQDDESWRIDGVLPDFQDMGDDVEFVLEEEEDGDGDYIYDVPEF